MSSLKTIIKETEDKWLDKLFIQVKTIFKEHKLPSHNEYHHLRVWNHALRISEVLYNEGIRIDKSDLENLIIAVFFHDTGLAVTFGSDHGNAGELQCREWLATNSIMNIADTQKILHAIRNHENKAYLHHTPLITNNRINLPGLLAVSDDLDAFGYAGIYRYMEIYLLRGIDLKELGHQVLLNIENRFRNFLELCSSYPSLINIHKIRYEIIQQFYMHYDEQIRNNDHLNNIIKGPVAIARLAYKQINQGSNSLERFCKTGIKQFIDKSDKEFFINLQKDWNTIKQTIKSAKD